MDRINEDRLDDEFEPIELGSVSEETNGVQEGGGESGSGTQNTRQ